MRGLGKDGNRLLLLLKELSFFRNMLLVFNLLFILGLFGSK